MTLHSGKPAFGGSLGLGGCLLLGLCTAISIPAFTQPVESRISNGDFLYIDVYRVPELTSSFHVGDDGAVRLPYIDSIHLAGLTEGEAAAAISQALIPILRNPRVKVVKSGFGRAGALAGRAAGMQMELIPLQNSNAESLALSLQGMTSPGGNVSFDAGTNTLLVTDTPDAIQNMMNVVSRLDQMESQLTQVRIEAKIAEVRVGALKELGVRWFIQGNEGFGGFYPLPPQDPAIIARQQGRTPFSNERIGSSNTNNSASVADIGRRFVDNMFDRRLQGPVQVPLPGQAFLGFMNSHIDLGILLDALVTDNDAQLLANPMTLTVNHKTAEIKMVDEFPYTEFGTEITGATNFSTKFLDLGIILQVTPHVYQDDKGTYVKLDVEPEVSFPVGSNNGVPIRSVRSSSTTANVRDGQTLVIGGILREDERQSASKVPGLGDLPVVGKLFSQKESAKQHTELMIFVTPTVHRRPEEITWDRMIDVSEELNERQLIPTSEIRGEARKD